MFFVGKIAIKRMRDVSVLFPENFYECAITSRVRPVLCYWRFLASQGCDDWHVVMRERS
jgi:hypothetical protein